MKGKYEDRHIREAEEGACIGKKRGSGEQRGEREAEKEEKSKKWQGTVSVKKPDKNKE